MDMKIIIGGIVVLVIVLAAPLLLNLLGAASPEPEARPAAPPAPPPPPPAEPPPAPVIWQGTHEPPPRPMAQYQQQSVGDGPELTAETLVGTAWEVNTPHGKVQIELGPNGQATASHPLVGSMPDSWQVQGNRVNASASFMGQTVSIDATIQGNRLSVPGQNVRRVR